MAGVVRRTVKRQPRSVQVGGVDRQALMMWPRLGRTALRRCGHDPWRIATLISHRTSMSREAILSLLVTPYVSPDDGVIWFG